MMLCLYLVLISMGAGFVQRVSGFGLGIFTMIFLPHLMPTHTSAATVTSFISCVAATYNAIRYKKNVRYKTVLPMLAAALLTIPVAVRFSSVVSGNVFKILLGIVLILLSLYFIFFNKRISIRPSLPNGLLSGFLAGALGGLFSTGGPPAVLYLSSAIADNRVYFASIQFYFCFTNLYTAAMRALNGVVTVDIVVYSFIGILGSLAGNAIGGFVFDKLDSNKLKFIIYLGMIISGIIMFF